MSNVELGIAVDALFLEGCVSRGYIDVPSSFAKCGCAHLHPSLVMDCNNCSLLQLLWVISNFDFSFSHLL